MRVAVFSDVHGNAVALEALLAELERLRPDRVVCLGDHVQGGAQPSECLELLRALDCAVVLGNADHEVLFPQRDIEEWTRDRLTPAQLDYIRSFEPLVAIDLGGARLVCFHGSPRSFEEVVLPDTPVDDVRAAMGGVGADVYAGGHVHLQWLRRVGSALWLCAGSVGLAYAHEQPDDDPAFDRWLEYAVVASDDGRLSVEFRRAPFDADAYVEALLASGRPRAHEFARGWAGE